MRRSKLYVKMGHHHFFERIAVRYLSTVLVDVLVNVLVHPISLAIVFDQEWLVNVRPSPIRSPQSFGLVD